MSLRASVLVIGSVNEDITVRVQRFPSPGETLLGLDVTYGLGGKGANQAVAAARTGVSTALLATVGDDAVGARLLGWLDERGVDTALVTRAADTASGTAHIAVDAAGENQIVVVPGANGLTRVVDEAAVARASIVVVQGEVPVAVIENAVAVARQLGTPVLLNLAPVVAVSADTLASVDYLVVNETEAGLLLGRHLTADNAVAALPDLGSAGTNVVVTLGAAGAVWREGELSGHLVAPTVTVADTTGAGDAFVGVMAAALASRFDLRSAAAQGIRAASLAVQLPGAAMTYPSFDLDAT
ncbi:ribokinase [Acidothermaceae bacterium B102]|nr:ribokinase [Acidothermaceae bacterium B102]